MIERIASEARREREKACNHRDNWHLRLWDANGRKVSWVFTTLNIMSSNRVNDPFNDPPVRSEWTSSHRLWVWRIAYLFLQITKLSMTVQVSRAFLCFVFLTKNPSRKLEFCCPVGFQLVALHLCWQLKSCTWLCNLFCLLRLRLFFWKNPTQTVISNVMTSASFYESKRY